MEITSLPFIYYNSGCYSAALISSENLYRMDNDTLYLAMTTLSLYHLEHYDRVISVVKSNTILLDYHEIRIVYIKSILKREKEDNIINYCSNTSKNIPFLLSNGDSLTYLLEKESIEKLFKAKLLKNTDIKKELMTAFKIDKRNLECLLLLKQLSLIDNEELFYIIDDNVEKEELRDFYKSLFTVKKSFFSPFYAEELSDIYFNSNAKLELFNLGVYMVEEYAESEITYFILGKYYLLAKNYKEAKACFYKSLEINKNYGKGYLSLGKAHSGIKECESAVQCFTFACKYMSSYKPLLYLAYEYHMMNNAEQANIYYKKALSFDNKNIIRIKYGDLLISMEKYNEAIEMIENMKSEGEEAIVINLLECYAYIFKKELNKAIDIITKVPESNWRVKVTLAYIYHLTNKIEYAIYYYTAALTEKGNCQVIEDLLAQALETVPVVENRVVKYGSDLYDALELKNICRLPL